MRLPRGIILALFTTAMAIMLAVANQAHARGAPNGFADLAERLLPSVVSIKAMQTSNTVNNEGGQGFQNPFPPGSPFNDLFEQFRNRGGEGQPSRPRFSQGSGFVIESDGIIVTNNHVIE
ncbi:MAG: serine protease, partial [Alphaproteobacteria bacterium]|nr:serine protease [Alphaproteobacteria bacterium]